MIPSVLGVCAVPDTTCVKLLVLPRKFPAPSPAYATLTVLEPEGRVVVTDAMPPASVMRAPRATPFVRNCTVPVGKDVAGETGVKVAVKVMLDPDDAGFCEEASAAAELAAVIVIVPLEKTNV